MTTLDNTRYFINGKEVTANRYAAMKRLNAYIGRKVSNGQMEAPTRAAWYTYEAAADAEYGIARYIENCKRFGYLKEEEAAPTDTPAKMETVTERLEAIQLTSKTFTTIRNNTLYKSRANRSDSPAVAVVGDVVVYNTNVIRHKKQIDAIYNAFEGCFTIKPIDYEYTPFSYLTDFATL